MTLSRRRPTGTGSLDLTDEEADRISACGVEKLKDTRATRRYTGDILTAIMYCGLLVDWCELRRGESVEFVYMFVHNHGVARGTGFPISCVGYENA